MWCLYKPRWDTIGGSPYIVGDLIGNVTIPLYTKPPGHQVVDSSGNHYTSNSKRVGLSQHSLYKRGLRRINRSS